MVARPEPMLASKAHVVGAPSIHKGAQAMSPHGIPALLAEWTPVSSFLEISRMAMPPNNEARTLIAIFDVLSMGGVRTKNKIPTEIRIIAIQRLASDPSSLLFREQVWNRAMAAEVPNAKTVRMPNGSRSPCLNSHPEESFTH